MKEIDLHGLYHDDAVDIVENILLHESSLGNTFEYKIITGNSPKLQIRLIQEVFDKHDFNYTVPPYNPGMILVSEICL